jgi:hypothetical protein
MNSSLDSLVQLMTDHRETMLDKTTSIILMIVCTLLAFFIVGCVMSRLMKLGWTPKPKAWQSTKYVFGAFMLVAIPASVHVAFKTAAIVDENIRVVDGICRNIVAGISNGDVRTMDDFTSRVVIERCGYERFLHAANAPASRLTLASR